MSDTWTRRTWLTGNTVSLVALVIPALPRSLRHATNGVVSRSRSVDPAARMEAQAVRLDPSDWQTLATHAVDAARTAGAHYADARLTRTVRHLYYMVGFGRFYKDVEEIGVGVRALVNGYWGFAASTNLAPDAIVSAARDAVAQATVNAKGPPRIVDLAPVPVVRGTWATPIRIDPFSISLEDKLDHIAYWKAKAEAAGVPLHQDGGTSWMQFVRQERVVTTSEGSLFSQTLYESGAVVQPSMVDPRANRRVPISIPGLDVAGKGWELLLDAKIPEHFPQSAIELRQMIALANTSKSASVGRYTLVCDGATMASLVEQTFGIATQLDRALGYEANASGTSFLDDPLAMVGTFAVATPHVTVTANRSAPAQLSTVQWDDEGVAPTPWTLIHDGMLTDFQTTRESAGWLAPYYHQHHLPMQSHGCAASEDALGIPLQHMPNLTFEPGAAAIRVEDLVADVRDGILVENGSVVCDFQARSGLLYGDFRQIKAGRLDRPLIGGAVVFSAKDLWNNITAIGGPSTQREVGWSQYENMNHQSLYKGQPPQRTSHSVRAVAATIHNQALIDPLRKI